MSRIFPEWFAEGRCFTNTVNQSKATPTLYGQSWLEDNDTMLSAKVFLGMLDAILFAVVVKSPICVEQRKVQPVLPTAMEVPERTLLGHLI